MGDFLGRKWWILGKKIAEYLRAKKAGK